MSNRQVYLDYAAATPLDPRVLEAMLPFLTGEYGNPSSIHAAGVRARKAIDWARATTAQAIGAHADEIVFTSGATESINLAVKGLLSRHWGHIVAVATEHPATLEAIASSGAEYTIVGVDSEGRISIDELIAAIRPDTVLVTVMLANNEIGVIHPIAEIGKAIQKLRKQSGSLFPLFHTDATQAATTIDLRDVASRVDLLTLSGSKMYGPKGSGMLYVRRGAEMAPLIHGGKQELKLRAGTENVAGIIGFAEALRLAQGSAIAESQRLIELRDTLMCGLLSRIPDAAVNGDVENRLANNVNISIPGIEGEELVLRLDSKGIACSTASACKGGSAPSHVLEALGLGKASILGSIRFSLGRQTTADDVACVLDILPALVAQMR